MGPFILQGSVNNSSFYSILKDPKHSIYFEKKAKRKEIRAKTENEIAKPSRSGFRTEHFEDEGRLEGALDELLGVDHAVAVLVERLHDVVDEHRHLGRVDRDVAHVEKGRKHVRELVSLYRARAVLKNTNS